MIDRKKCIAFHDERNDFITAEDGFVYFWPTGHGFFAEHQLRWIADELESRNEKWNKQIENDMDEWHQYKRKGLAEMKQWHPSHDMTGVSVSQADLDNGSPKDGDMIARNPKDHSDMWLVEKKYFEDNFQEA